MSEAEQMVLEKHLKRTTIIANSFSIIVALITAFSVGIGFYYQTKNSISNHTDQINDVKVDVKEVKVEVKQLAKDINGAQIFQGASQEQIKALQDQTIDIKKNQDRIEDKIDRILGKL